MRINYGISKPYGRRLVATALVVSLAALAPEQANSSDWAPALLGGVMAGHLLTNFGQEQRERTEAMQEMARGGGGYGGGYEMRGGGGYGRQPMPQQQYAAPALSPEKRLQQLDTLAAGGYITPQQYKERRQAILDSM